RNQIDLEVSGRVGEPLRVGARCGGHAVTHETESVLQAARRAGLDAAILTDKLAGFGGTPFRLGQLQVADLADGLHVPLSELKELRRRIVADLQPRIERGQVRVLEASDAIARVAAKFVDVTALPEFAPVVVPLLRSEEQLEAAIASGVGEVELDWMEFVGLGKAFERARASGLRVTVATTRIGKPGEDALMERIFKLEPDGILVRHFGALMRCLAQRKQGTAAVLHGDFSLNASNSLTARHLLQLGLESITASFDLDEKQLF